MVHHLLSAYELDNDFTLVEPELATADDLRLFHSSNYVDYLMAQNDKDPIRVDMDQTNDSADDPDEKDDDTDEDEDVHEEHGIGIFSFILYFSYDFGFIRLFSVKATIVHACPISVDSQKQLLVLR